MKLGLTINANLLVVRYIQYDKIFDYLKSTTVCAAAPVFNYVIRPQLTDVQLNTIKCAIETAYRFVGPPRWNEACRNYIIRELAKEYDLANEKFMSFYDNIFAELSEQYEEEAKVCKKHKEVVRITNQL